MREGERRKLGEWEDRKERREGEGGDSGSRSNERREEKEVVRDGERKITL